MIAVVRTLEDGAVVVVDDSDGWQAVVRRGQYEDWRAVGGDRAALEALVAANRTGGDPRTEVDQQTVETAQNAATGEAHQEGER